MDVEGEKWVTLPKYSDRYRKGVEAFVNQAFSRYAIGNELKCPCKKCGNRFWSGAKAIHEHLVCNGPCPHSVEWIYEVSTHEIDRVADEMDINIGLGLGDEFDALIQNAYGTNDVTDHVGRTGLNDDARKFYRLVKEGGQLLYPECKKFSRLSFLVRLYQLKCIHGFSESGFSDLLELIKEVFPHVNLPSSFSVAKENERLENYAKCGTSRWRVVEKKAKARSDANIELASNPKIPAKVMRYFPLKPRLQRMFLSSGFSSSMTWHALSRKKDGRLRHPADGKGWKLMDSKYLEFAAEMRNVRLGLAADVYPGNEIDVYMQPLIAELKELWAVGIETYDARLDNTFKLHASLLWTISDFPRYGILSGWSTKGKLACPSCHYETSSTYLKHSKKVVYLNHRKFLPPDHKWRSDRRRFNRDVEMLSCPDILSGAEVEELLRGYKNDFGKPLKRNRGTSDCPWKKKSIFLSYHIGAIIWLGIT
ncbi:uncharacterized protein LOC141665601 [Apium graveolens]|uniref:uncharacterized protein LOC141665601 n=1 Tax=Apium graveolens TaxID=4045 RepID=UPI003D7BF265